MAVVTISREFGSAGSAVAARAAELLGYHLADKTTIGRILQGYGLVEFDKAYELESGFWTTIDARQRAMVSMVERVSLAIARHGNSVILGRGSYVVLAKAPAVLNVRIRAPFEWRVARVMEDLSLDRRSAEAEVHEGDKVRSSFVSAIYGLRWDSMERFDLVVDTSKMGIERVAQWIAEAARDLSAAGKEAGVGGADRRLGEPDAVLDAAVSQEFRCEKAH